VLLAVLATIPAGVAHALGIRSPVPVAVRARLDVHLLATRESGEWNTTSRSPADPSRFMLDLTAGNADTGILYVKGASSWSDGDDALGRVRFRAEQGDYTRAFLWSDSSRADVRLFGDERRFFTHEMGTAVVEDDAVAAFEHRLGARLDGRITALGATYWIAGLDDGDDTRTNQYASLRFAPDRVYVGLGYVHDDPAGSTNHALAKGELAGYLYHATALASFEQSGSGSGAAFPSGSWDSLSDGYAEAAPSNAATFAELRTRRTRLGEDHLLDASYQYGAVGADYVNDLSSLVPGSVTNRAWVDWAHRRYALDARLSAHRIERDSDDITERAIDMTTRARLVDNAEVLLRGGAVRDEFPDTRDETHGFVHAAYSRELREFMGGLHLLVDEIGSEAAVSAGAEVRLNWSATGAITARWIVSDATGGSDAVYARLEFRPTRRTWVTLAYGHENRGDDAYFLEDRDVLPAPDAGNVITFSVRGDL
jgi:hypothetical protein